MYLAASATQSPGRAVVVSQGDQVDEAGEVGEELQQNGCDGVNVEDVW